MRILAISGSLRTGSHNTDLLQAAAAAAPDGVDVELYDGLKEIPPYDADDDIPGDPPEAVERFKSALADADAILISTPEYNSSIPGVLKNALDWVVGSGELVDKPVGLLSASSASRFAHPQLLETLRTMTARLVPLATVIVDVPRREMTASEIVADAALATRLQAVLHALLAARESPHIEED